MARMAREGGRGGASAWERKAGGGSAGGKRGPASAPPAIQHRAHLHHSAGTRPGAARRRVGCAPDSRHSAPPARAAGGRAASPGRPGDRDRWLEGGWGSGGAGGRSRLCLNERAVDRRRSAPAPAPESLQKTPDARAPGRRARARRPGRAQRPRRGSQGGSGPTRLPTPRTCRLSGVPAYTVRAGAPSPPRAPAIVAPDSAAAAAVCSGRAACPTTPSRLLDAPAPPLQPRAPPPDSRHDLQRAQAAAAVRRVGRQRDGGGLCRRLAPAPRAAPARARAARGGAARRAPARRRAAAGRRWW
jgi:hypothetical protein